MKIILFIFLYIPCQLIAYDLPNLNCEKEIMKSKNNNIKKNHNGKTKRIVKLGDPQLRTKCQAVENFTAVQPVIDLLEETLNYVQSLYNFTRGSGVSAPQVGYLYRISIVEFEKKRQVLINPVIITLSKQTINIREGCLSFFNFRGNVDRAEYIKIGAQDRNGEYFELEATGDFAMLLQHELDHLEGILYFDHLAHKEKDMYPVKGMPIFD